MKWGSIHQLNWLLFCRCPAFWIRLKVSAFPCTSTSVQRWRGITWPLAWLRPGAKKELLTWCDAISWQLRTQSAEVSHFVITDVCFCFLTWLMLMSVCFWRHPAARHRTQGPGCFNTETADSAVVRSADGSPKTRSQTRWKGRKWRRNCTSSPNNECVFYTMN